MNSILPPSRPDSANTPPSASARPNTGPGLVARIFLGRHGLRAGWRLLIFVCVMAALVLSTGPLLSAALRRVASRFPGMSAPNVLVSDGWLLLLLFLATWVMARIEKRGFGDYGLPWRKAFRARFWEGAVWGIVALTALLGALMAARTLSLSGGGLSSSAAVEQGLLWGAGFLAVGFFEEFLFRGYALATLADGIGFWPAAVLLSLAFGSIHLGNTGEDKLGALMAASIGFVFCLSLRRTGSLWFAIGLHASWDWAETYFYGVPNSGQVASAHLLSSSSRGPVWLAGGSVGPEGSVLALALMVVLWFALAWRFPNVRFPAAGKAAEQSS